MGVETSVASTWRRKVKPCPKKERANGRREQLYLYELYEYVSKIDR